MCVRLRMVIIRWLILPSRLTNHWRIVHSPYNFLNESSSHRTRLCQSHWLPWCDHLHSSNFTDKAPYHSHCQCSVFSRNFQRGDNNEWEWMQGTSSVFAGLPRKSPHSRSFLESIQLPVWISIIFKRGLHSSYWSNIIISLHSYGRLFRDDSLFHDTRVNWFRLLQKLHLSLNFVFKTWACTSVPLTKCCEKETHDSLYWSAWTWIIVDHSLCDPSVVSICAK